MPKDTDQAYDQRGEFDARRLVEEATDPAIRRIHLNLAKLYSEMADSIMQAPDKPK